MKKKTKFCPRCFSVKLITDFHKCKALKDGLAYYCKDCYKDYNRKWLANNKEKAKEKNEKWKEKNYARWYDLNKKYQYAWRKKHREEYNAKMNKKNKEYYWKNRESILRKLRIKRLRKKRGV